MADENLKTSSSSSTENEELQSSFLVQIFNEIVQSPLNLALIGFITLLIYKIMKERNKQHTPPVIEPELPKLRRDFTIQELKEFDGKQSDGRVLVAVNGSVYDVTKGKRFYGPGGPYAAFGGRDASRGLATFSVTSSEKEEYDDLSDLNSMEMESVREWEMQFKEKYTYVGRLLKPGEQPTNYSDEDDDSPNDSSSATTTAAAAQKTNDDEEKTTNDDDKVKTISHDNDADEKQTKDEKDKQEKSKDE
uniref:Putative membrane associated progesterone receptor n=1 Tax=Corethrella appendiculata TaxID=1370023 RepID=U5EFV8_9DIPT